MSAELTVLTVEEFNEYKTKSLNLLFKLLPVISHKSHNNMRRENLSIPRHNLNSRFTVNSSEKVLKNKLTSKKLRLNLKYMLKSQVNFKRMKSKPIQVINRNNR